MAKCWAAHCSQPHHNSVVGLSLRSKACTMPWYCDPHRHKLQVLTSPCCYKQRTCTRSTTGCKWHVRPWLKHHQALEVCAVILWGSQKIQPIFILSHTAGSLMKDYPGVCRHKWYQPVPSLNYFSWRYHKILRIADKWSKFMSEQGFKINKMLLEKYAKVDMHLQVSSVLAIAIAR